MCDSVSHGSADCPSASSPQLAVQLLRGRSTRLGLRTYVQTSILRGPACTTRGANSGTCSWSIYEADGSLSLHPPLPHSFPGSPFSHLNAAPLASGRMPSVFFSTRISRSVSCREYSNQHPQQSRNMGSAYKHQESTWPRIVACALLWRRRKKKRRVRGGAQRRVWLRPIFRKRRQQGEFHNLLQDMRLCDPDSHFSYIRMSVLTQVRMTYYYSLS